MINFGPMKLEQLHYFIEAAKAEHIAKAAKTCAISPSAISHSISQLEEELGRELFLKNGKNIQLTTHGRLLKERAVKILADVNLMKDEMAAEGVELRGNFRMAASHDLCVPALLPAWLKLQSENSQLLGEVFTLRSSQIVTHVLTGEMDLGICFNPLVHPDLSHKKLFEGNLVFAFRKNHPILKIKEADRYSALSNFPCALPKSFQGIEVCERHPIFERFEIKTNPIFLYDAYHVAIEKIKKSDAWSLVPDFVVQQNKSHVSALKTLENWEATYFVSAIFSNNRIQSGVLKKLLVYLKEQYLLV